MEEVVFLMGWNGKQGLAMLLAAGCLLALCACGGNTASEAPTESAAASSSAAEPSPAPAPAEWEPVPEAEGMTAIDLGRMAFYVPEEMEVTETEDDGAHVAAAAFDDVSYLFYGYDAELPFSMEYMDEEMRAAYAKKMAEDSGFSYDAVACEELGTYPFAVYKVTLPETGNAALIFHTVVDGSAYTLLASAEGRGLNEDDAAAASLVAMTLTAKEAAQ